MASCSLISSGMSECERTGGYWGRGGHGAPRQGRDLQHGVRTREPCPILQRWGRWVSLTDLAMCLCKQVRPVPPDGAGRRGPAGEAGDQEG